MLSRKLCHVNAGDLVIWCTPDKQTVLGLAIEQEIGHGGAATGWWRVLADVGKGPRKYLTRASNCEILRRRDQ